MGGDDGAMGFLGDEGSLALGVVAPEEEDDAVRPGGDCLDRGVRELLPALPPMAAGEACGDGEDGIEEEDSLACPVFKAAVGRPGDGEVRLQFLEDVAEGTGDGPDVGGDGEAEAVGVGGVGVGILAEDDHADGVGRGEFEGAEEVDRLGQDAFAGGGLGREEILEGAEPGGLGGLGEEWAPRIRQGRDHGSGRGFLGLGLGGFAGRFLALVGRGFGGGELAGGGEEGGEEAGAQEGVPEEGPGLGIPPGALGEGGDPALEGLDVFRIAERIDPPGGGVGDEVEEEGADEAGSDEGDPAGGRLERAAEEEEDEVGEVLAAEVEERAGVEDVEPLVELVMGVEGEVGDQQDGEGGGGADASTEVNAGAEEQGIGRAEIGRHEARPA